MLPLLQAEVVPPGWVTNDDFLAGYGAAQAVPGPLFTFAAYLGAVIGGWWAPPSALSPSFSVFPPVIGVSRSGTPCAAGRAQAAFRGVNAAVVGLLLAALYDPVWTTGINGPQDFAIAVAAFLLLFMWSVTPWLVVVLCAAAAAASAYLPGAIF